MSDLDRFLQAGQAAQRAVDELGAGPKPSCSTCARAGAYGGLTFCGATDRPVEASGACELHTARPAGAEPESNHAQRLAWPSRSR